MEDDIEWANLRESLARVWARNPNMGARRLRDYVGTGADIERVVRVYRYLTAPTFAGFGNEQTEALRKFCERRYRKYATGGAQNSSLQSVKV